MLKQCMNSLKIYTTYRRKKTLQKLKLKEYADAQLVYKIYQSWSEKFQLRQKINEIEYEINQFKNKFMLLRALNYWKLAYENRMKLKLKEAQVKRFYQKKLKRKVFEIIKENYAQEKRGKEILLRAENFDRYWLKKRFYDQWSEKMDEKNEIKSMHIVYKAKKHHETNVVKKCLRLWIEFTIELRKLNVVFSTTIFVCDF
jgi:hypothetical protein